MIQWEYTYALIVKSEDPCEEINKLGVEGWEVIAHWSENKENDGGFFLKRQKPQTEDKETRIRKALRLFRHQRDVF